MEKSNFVENYIYNSLVDKKTKTGLKDPKYQTSKYQMINSWKRSPEEL